MSPSGPKPSMQATWSCQVRSRRTSLNSTRSERESFLQDIGLDEPGLHKLARAAYRLLGLETYFTAGEKEIRAWTVPAGTKAPQAAGVIHTDFEHGFIRAEVYTLPDLETCGNEAALKAKGLLRVEGKEYTVQDGDILHFRFNV